MVRCVARIVTARDRAGARSMLEATARRIVTPTRRVSRRVNEKIVLATLLVQRVDDVDDL